MAQPDHLYVLAGGASRRFGSDKALADVDGRPMIGDVIERMGGGAQRVTLVTGSAARYNELGYDVITDRPAGVGPIGGLNAALHHRFEKSGDGWLLLASCDLVRPDRQRLDMDLVARGFCSALSRDRNDQFRPDHGGILNDSTGSKATRVLGFATLFALALALLFALVLSPPEQFQKDGKTRRCA